MKSKQFTNKEDAKEYGKKVKEAGCKYRIIPTKKLVRSITGKRWEVKIQWGG